MVEEKNKRILFFANVYMGYEKLIEQEMRSMGYEVDVFDERSVKKSYEKALIKISPNIFKFKTEKYYKDIIEKVKLRQYDIVFFVKCDMPTQKVMEDLKSTFPKAKFCLYMWDSICNIPNIKSKFKYFDYINTFDRKDSENEKIGFRPLFYAKEYEKKANSNKEYQYDFCFIGTIHSERFKLLQTIKELAKKMNRTTFFYMYLQKKYVFYFYKLVKRDFFKADIKDFKFQKIDSDMISDIIEKSKVIIDAQHPRQTGMTMRTIEMIGMKKKLITTNKDIANYDFYRPSNICIIDKNEIRIDQDFLECPYEELPDSVYAKYSLHQWMLDVLGIEDKTPLNS